MDLYKNDPVEEKSPDSKLMNEGDKVQTGFELVLSIKLNIQESGGNEDLECS